MTATQTHAMDQLNCDYGPLDRRDKTNIWRYGEVFTWSPVAGQWIARASTISLPPNASLLDMERVSGDLIVIQDK